MIFLKRRRLLVWLIKAYLKKWRRNIFTFFSLGLGFFFFLYFLLKIFNPILPFENKQTIGIVGTYTTTNLPMEVLSKLSYGLTYISADGKPKPMASTSWSINDSGKTYVFKLKDNIFFNDGKKLTSSSVGYNFSNVKVETPDPKTIVFKLKESYSPFPVTVSRPILKKNFVGLGDYKINKLETNGDFVESIQLIPKKPGLPPLIYQFYPTEDALKTALALGEINTTRDLQTLDFMGTSFDKFKTLKIAKRVNYGKLVTLFYNTQDKVLSDKRLREALTYTIPNEFSEGKRNRTPYPPTFWVSQESAVTIEQDFNHAKLLLSESSASDSASLRLSIKTLSKYKSVAQRIRNSFNEIGIKSDIEVVNSVPASFQVFLGDYNVSKDPDQYPLWHSDQPNNITGYKSLRIDKLLEDGRQIFDPTERIKIYSDFQKYLLDDSPAAFLYFPYYYTVIKK